MKTNQKTRHTGEYNISLPTAWSEVSLRELKILSKAIISGGIPEKIYMLAMLSITGISVVSAPDAEGRTLVSLPGGLFRRLRDVDIQHLMFAAKKLSFITEPIPKMCPLPRFRGRESVQQSLYGVSLIHYLAMDNAYQAYLATEDSKWIHYLAAYVYWGTAPFDDDRTAWKAKLIRFLPEWRLYAVLLWFNSVKYQIAKRYPFLYHRADPSEEEEGASNGIATIRSMILALNNGDATKNNEVLRLPVNDALMQLDAKAQEIQELEKVRKR